MIGPTTHFVSRWHVDYAVLVEKAHWVTRVQTFTTHDHAAAFAQQIATKDYIRCVNVTGAFDHEVPV